MTNNFDLGKLIQKHELLTSSTLIGRCVAAGFDQTHARQLVRRGSARNGIWRSEKLALQNNGRLFSHSSFKGSEDFTKQLLPILSSERPGLYRLTQKLLLDEVVLKPHAQMLLATPVDPKKVRYPSYEAEIAALEEATGGRTEAKDTVGERLVLRKLAGTSNGSAAGLKAQTALLIEVALAKILLDHFRRQNFVSWNYSVLGKGTRHDLETFNNYLFFAATFSWLAPLVRWESDKPKPKPMPVVFHVCSNSCTTWDVEGFAARVKRAGANKTSKLRILGILAAANFDAKAWKRAKEEGFLAINLHQLFGDAAFEAIVQVQELLKNVAGDPAYARDDEYQELSQTLQGLKTNPFIADLKSLAFEILTGFLIKNQGWEEVQFNLKVPFKLPDGVTDREVDVSGQKNAWDEVCIIECKAEAGAKLLDEGYVRKFFTQTVPAFLGAKCPNRNPSNCKAEIWTTGVVTDAARKALHEIELKKFVAPALRGREQLIQEVPSSLESAKRLIQTIAEL